VIEPIKLVLAKAGVAAGAVAALAQKVAKPPAGTIDAAELRVAVEEAPQPGREARIALPATHGCLLRPLGSYCLKGKETPVRVAEVMGEDDGSHFAQRMKEEIAQIREAVEYFQQGQLGKPQPILAQLEVLARQEGQTMRAKGYQYLANKAKEYLEEPPEPWDGAIHMEEK
jgi:hypothetical protein